MFVSLPLSSMSMLMSVLLLSRLNATVKAAVQPRSDTVTSAPTLSRLDVCPTAVLSATKAQREKPKVREGLVTA